MYLHPSKDVTKPSDEPPFWTTVKISTAVLAACLPPLGPLIRLAPNPSKFYDSMKGNLGLHSSRAELTQEVFKPAHISNTEWLNLPDRKESGDEAANTVNIYGRMQGPRQSLDV